MSAINGITLTQVDFASNYSATLSTTLLNIDGINVATGDTVLFTKLTDATKNGIYTATVTGSSVAWARTTGFTTSGNFTGGLFIEVTGGNIFADTLWYIEPNGSFVLDTSSMYVRSTHSSAITAIQAGTTAVPTSVYVSAALEAGAVVSAAPARFVSISGYNSKASAQFIQIHNTSAAAAEGAAPADFITVPAQSSFTYTPFGTAGDSYSTGIYVCNSSTAITKTIGAADCWFRVRYIL